jgi:hypothetical protein
VVGKREVAMIDKAVQVAGREWENLRSYLEMCGDIGGFDFDDLRDCKWFNERNYHEGFISNIINMQEKLPQCEYATPEAMNVLTVLASKAAERLGLEEDLALAFGMGYGLVQTGLLSGQTVEPRQIIFHRMFYPFGVNPDWNFAPDLVKKKLKIVYERFRSWQDNPETYGHDLNYFQNMEEAWKEWEGLVR